MIQNSFRRPIISYLLILVGLSFAFGLPSSSVAKQQKPNIILCMCDDLGWGDTGYNGHRVLKTPNLDQMAKEGVRFTRFYAAAPVCSPTRGSCLTGRHPYRYGVFFANTGHLKKEELTLAEILKTQGYTTGHFGKWHLGTLTTKIKDANRGKPGSTKNFSPPWKNGFDTCFSTESKVPTWDPLKKPKGVKSKNTWKPLTVDAEYKHYGTHYWTGPEQLAKENLDGDDSRVIMDRALPFIRESSKKNTPFFAVIWFHTPHLPVVAGPKFAAMYPKQDLFHRNYYGCVTAMDQQVGRLRSELEKLGVANNTMLWFSSDNGPEGNQKSPGTTGGLRGRKRSLYEGGVRVPGLLVWPQRLKKPQVVKTPCSSSDYFPTVMDVLGYKIPPNKTRPYDGESLLALLDGKKSQRSRPIGFQSRNQLALIDHRYKIYRSGKNGQFELYDLIKDPAEKNNLAKKEPEIVAKMAKSLKWWQESCKKSLAGNDY